MLPLTLLQLLVILCVIEVESVIITVSNKIINTTDDRFVSYTIDIGQIDTKLMNFSNPQFIYLTSQWPSYLRVGGTDGDYTYYEIGNENPCHLPTNQSHSYYCLSMDTFNKIVQFASITKSKLVFGLSMGFPYYPKSNTIWNDSNTYQFLKYLHDVKHYNSSNIYGFELGNEMNSDPYNNATIQSNSFKTLRDIIDEIWGNSNDIKLFGPDPHSYTLRKNDKAFKYIPDFVDETCKILNGVTYHCYIDVNKSAMLTPSGLNEQYNESVRISNIWNQQRITNQSKHCANLVHNIWAGEIAEHNSGLKQVSYTYYDGFWYLDALGTLSNLGHAVFARQCLSESSYALIGKNYNPNPDYYTAYLFNKLMSNKVIKIESNDNNLRIYAHCTRNGRNNSVSMAYINLNRYDTSIEYDASILMKNDIYVWILTPGNTKQGLQSLTMSLNGNILKLENGKLPSFNGKMVNQTNNEIKVPGYSYGFISFHSTLISVCG